MSESSQPHSATKTIEHARACLAARRFGEAEELLIEGLRQAEASGDDTLIASVQLDLGDLRLRRGDHDAARASAVAALEIVNRKGYVRPRALASYLLGRVLRAQGATELAEQRLREAEETAEKAGVRLVQVDALCELAHLFRADARLQDALRTMNRAYLLVHRAHPAIEANAGRERMQALEDLYVDTARDLAILAELAGVADAGRGERVMRIAEAILDALEVEPAERVPVLFAAQLHEVVKASKRGDAEPQPGEHLGDRTGQGHPTAVLRYDTPPLRGLELPWDLEALLRSRYAGETAESCDTPQGERMTLGARIIALADAIARTLMNAPAGTPLQASHVRTALTLDYDHFGPDLMRALERIDWEAIFARRLGRIAHAGEVAGPAAESSGAADRSGSSKGTILLVEDHADIRKILVDYLSAKGFRVETASTGDGFFSLIGRLRPDLVLLDIMLPGRDGRFILDRLRASPHWSNIPVIIITALRDSNEAARALAKGADDYVEKPFDPATLHARIERLLASRRALQEAEAEKNRQELLLGIIRELATSVDTQNMLSRLVHRVAETIGVAKCSLLLAEPGAKRARLVVAYDNPTLHDPSIDLDVYPEIRRALESGEVVVIDDVYAEPLLDEVRRKWATAVNVRSSAVIPLRVEGAPIGVFFVRTTWDEPPLERSAVAFATEVAEAAGKALEYARRFEHISAELTKAQREANAYRSLALSDPLTGLANRAALESIGTHMFHSAKALDQPLSVIMLDLDNFKGLNDAFGHAAGDQVLKHVGEVLSAAASDQDLVVRYGGDEFCLILPRRQLHEASRFGQLLCERIREIRTPRVNGAKVEVSVGVATYPATAPATLKQLISSADQALFRAKRAGGGHLQIAFTG